MELSMLLQGFIKFTVVVFFILAMLALIWYAAIQVLSRLFDAARLTHTYFSYRSYLNESEKALKKSHLASSELMPVPFISVGKRKLQYLLDSGFVTTGVLLARGGETCQINSLGRITHTGIKGAENAK